MDDTATRRAELAEHLLLEAGALAELFATRAASINAKILIGEGGSDFVRQGRTIALLSEAAAALAQAGR